jgi:uncharacterized protein YjbI with pentapeptide repeats
MTHELGCRTMIAPDVTLDSALLLKLLNEHTTEEWNLWTRRLLDSNLVISVWKAGEKPPPIMLSLSLACADLSHRDLYGRDVSACDLSGTKFDHASLRGTTIRWAPLASFINADLRESRFIVAEISGSDFTGAQMQGSYFKDVSFERTVPPIGLPDDLMARCIAYGRAD